MRSPCLKRQALAWTRARECHRRELALVCSIEVQRLIATVIGILGAAVAAFVLVGMIDGADPTFSKGRSSTESVIVQEVVGGFALLALGVAITGCIAVARGKRVGLPLIALV